jgi:WD40 repeat protein
MIIALLELPLRYLFGRDLFISYSRSDARKYAPALAITLQKRMPKLSFYLDRWIAPASGKLPLSLRLHLRWSSILVVVCTERAVASRFVQDEVAKFATLGRKVVTIDVEGAFSEVRGQEPWVNVSGADPEEEMCAAITKGKPSENVIERILKMVEFTTQDRRLRRAVWATFAFVVLSVGGVGVYAYKAKQDADEAEARAIKADDQAKAAETRAADAQKKEEDAKQARVLAESQTLEANKKREEAVKAQAKAEDLQAQAEEKAGEALEKERVATAEAQKQQKIAHAQRLTAENNLAADPQSQEIEKKILFTVESMRRYSSREAYSNLIEAIRITPRPLTRLSNHAEKVSDLTFSPDGKYLATLSNGELSLHKVDVLNTGGEIGEFQTVTRADEGITSFAFSPDGTYLSAASKSGVRRIWLTKTMKELTPVPDSAAALFGASKPVGPVADSNLSPNAKYSWSKDEEADGETITLSKTDTRERVIDKLRALDFSPDGRFLVTTSYDPEYAELTETIVWDVSGDSLRRLHSLGTTRVYSSTGNKFSPDGTRLAQVMNDNRLKVWNTLTGQLVAFVKYEGQYKGVAFTHDGRFMALATDKNVTLWPTGREWKSSEFVRPSGRGPERFITEESQMALSPDGKLMAFASGANVNVFNTTNGQRVLPLSMPCNVKGLSFSMRNERVVTHGPCGVFAWQLREGTQPERAGNLPKSFEWVAFSRDMKYAAVAGGEGATVIELANPSNVIQLKRNDIAASDEDDESEGDQKVTVAFSSDGNRVAAVSRSRIDVWEWRTGRLLHATKTQTRGNGDYNSVSVAFDEDDNNTLITADRYEALVWNLHDMRVVGRVELQETGRNTNFLTILSPNGKFVSTTLNVFATGDKSPFSKTTVWQLRPMDVWKNACSRLQNGSLSDADWKKEFGTEKLRDTCDGLALSKRP